MAVVDQYFFQVSTRAANTSKQLPKASEELPTKAESRTSQMWSSISQLLPKMSQLLPGTSQEQSPKSSLSDRPKSEELTSKPSAESLQDESEYGISRDGVGMEKDASRMEIDEDRIRKDEDSMEIDVENAADKSSTKMEKPTSPLPSKEDQEDAIESKQQDYMGARSQESDNEDKASPEKEKNDFTLPIEENLKNENDNEQVKRNNGQENKMLKHGIGSKSKDSLVDLNGKKAKKNKRGEFFLSIPKQSFWLDVRPYEFLK